MSVMYIDKDAFLKETVTNTCNKCQYDNSRSNNSQRYKEKGVKIEGQCISKTWLRGTNDAVFIKIRSDTISLWRLWRFCERPSVRRRIFFRVNAATGQIGLLCPARGIASLHGHYKAINHINRAKEAGPGGWYPLFEWGRSSRVNYR